MSRNWMRHSHLPAKFWFFALKRACEVCNILPTKHTNTITTPHELVYNQKVDYRVLFPMFSVAYINKYTQNGKTKNKWEGHSLKCIVIGQCPQSNALLFFHPPTKQVLSSATYKFDPFLASGPQFGEKYDGTFVMSNLGDMEHIHILPTHQQGDRVFTSQQNGSIITATVLQIPLIDDEEPYAIQDIETGDITEIMKDDILTSNPTSTPTNDLASTFPHIPWLKHDTKITLYINRN